MKRSFEIITTRIYLFAATALTLMALSIMAWSVYEVFAIVTDFSLKSEFILVMLQSVGAIVIVCLGLYQRLSSAVEEME